MIEPQLKDTKERVQWFCKQFDVQPPRLEFDKDDPVFPDAVLITDESYAWVIQEGVSFDWLVPATDSPRSTGLAQLH